MSRSDLELWLSFVQAALWPLMVLLSVLALRRPLAELLGGLDGRLSSLSVMGWVTLEFAEVTETRLDWSLGSNFDFRGLTEAGQLTDTYAGNLTEILAQPGVMDFAVFDLEQGESWLTTRLYLFTLLLERRRGLRCLVFTTTKGTTGRFFLGTASPAGTRKALATAYPWLDAAVVKAIRNLPPTSPDHQRARAEQTAETFLDDYLRGQQGSHNAQFFARAYLREVQEERPGTPPDEWLQLPTPTATAGLPQREHASWITPEDITSGALKSAVRQDSYVQDEASWRNEDRARAIINASGHYVGLLNASPAGRFSRLIDRHALLERLGASCADQ